MEKRKQLLTWNQFAIDDLMIVASDLLCGLNLLHTNQFIHRDVCLQNVLFVEEEGKVRIKLTDFGMSRSCGKGTLPLTTGIKIQHVHTAPESRSLLSAVDVANAKAVDAWSAFVSACCNSLSGRRASCWPSSHACAIQEKLSTMSCLWLTMRTMQNKSSAVCKSACSRL